MHRALQPRLWLEALGILLLRAVFYPWPLRWASALGEALGWFLFAVVRLERARTLENLAIALGACTSEAERMRLARACYRHFGALIGEFLCEPRLAGRKLDAFMELENPGLLEQRLQGGQGVIVATGHLGNWELFGSALAARGYPTTAYVGRQHNPFADGFINAVRRGMGVEVLSRREGMRGMLRSLHKGRALVIASDQHFSRHRHFVRFFGHPVSAAPGLAALIQHKGLPAVFAEVYKVGRFRYRARFLPLPLPPRSGNDELDQLRITQAYFDTLEAVVRRHPEQYFWMHRRWRPLPTELLTATNRAFLDGTAPPDQGGAAPLEGDVVP